MIELIKDVYLGNDFEIESFSKQTNNKDHSFYTITIKNASGENLQRSCPKEEIKTIIQELQDLIA